MSATATFTLLPLERVTQLVDAAEQGALATFLAREGRPALTFDACSAFVFGTLIPYLEERHALDLTGSSFADLAADVQGLGGSYLLCIFDVEQRASTLDKLDPKRFTKTELASYWREFNDDDQPAMGDAMLACVRALHTGMSKVDAQHVLVFDVA